MLTPSRPASQLSNQFASDLGGIQALRASARAGDPEALKAAAKQFEALFVQTMLKTMRETRFSAEGDVYADSSSLKMYQELLDQQWAQKMVDGKGFGFADLIAKRLTLEGTFKAEAQARASQVDATSPSPSGSSDPDAVRQPPETKSTAPHTVSASELGGVAQDASTTLPAGVAANSATGNPALDRKRQFLETMRPHAEAAEQATGIPARFILAHAALESGWGAREIQTDTGTASHNLFGIKAGANWSGATADIQTTEYRHGLAMKITDRFRAYADYGEAFGDYAQLLQRRYREAAEAGEDAKAFADGLVNGGYATDPAYADKLRAVIRSVAAAEV